MKADANEILRRNGPEALRAAFDTAIDPFADDPPPPNGEREKFGGTASAPSDGPIPLFPPLPPAERFPIESLGPALSQPAAAITRKVQVPRR